MSFLKLFESSELIAAHRGARSIYPENTLSAIRACVGHCDFIEVDIQLSSDKVPIVIHDDTLDRTTDIASKEIYKERKPYKVSEFTYDELCSLDYGSWFYHDDDRPEPLLTLRCLLEFIKENNQYINLEIKDMHDSFNDKEVVASIIKEIDEFDIDNFILFSSFRHEYLTLCKEKSQIYRQQFWLKTNIQKTLLSI